MTENESVTDKLRGSWNNRNQIEKSVNRLFGNLYFDVHAVYAPSGSGPAGDWYTAAVDLFHPGMTFRLCFSLTESGEIQVEHLERWFIG